MPFQVSFSTFVQQLGTITSFSPGQDATITCQPGNTLVATIVGDLTGHTFTWVQIPAPGFLTFIPVTWITGSPQFGGTSGTVTGQMVSATYLQSEDTDKYFRFYIDYGTAHQEYADVANYNTPIAKQYLYSHLPANTGPRVDLGLNFVRTLSRFVTLTLQPYETVDGMADSPPTTYDLTATFTADVNQISSIIVQQNPGSGWVTLNTSPASSIVNNTFVYGPVSSGPSYRVILTFVGNQGFFAYPTTTSEPSDAVWVSLGNPTIVGLSNETMPVNEHIRGATSTFTVFIPTLKIFGPNPPQDSFTLPVDQIVQGAASTFTVFIPTLKVFGPSPPTDSITLPVDDLAPPGFSVFAVSNNGGTGVGGP